LNGEERRTPEHGVFLHDVISKKGQGLVSSTAKACQTIVDISDVLTAPKNFVAYMLRGCLFWGFQGVEVVSLFDVTLFTA